MKRVIFKALVADSVERKDFEWVVKGVGEVESYEERVVPKDVSFVDEFSFDYLLDGAKELVNGVWSAVKGFFKLTSWSVVTIVVGIKWLWVHGAGAEKKRDGEKDLKVKR